MAIQLEYICYTGFTGYAIAAKNTICALHHSGQYDIKLTSLDFDLSARTLGAKNLILFQELARKKNDLRRTQILHIIPDMQRRFTKSVKTIGVAVYETRAPPAHWISVLNNNDAIIVPSRFCFNIFMEAGLKKPIFYVPHCLDMEMYHLNVKPLYSWDKFTYLYLGSWRVRKGYKELLAAWIQEFKKEDSVQLVIKTDKPALAQSEITKFVHNLQDDVAPIIIDERRYSDDEMPGFIKSANCLVAPTMGEGFFLSGLQSMALGVPVVITDYSGCQDYATEQSAFLLKPEGFKNHKVMDGIPQFCNKEWAVVSPEQIGHVMRYVLRSPEIRKMKATTAQTFVSQNFGYNRIVASFAGIMNCCAC